MTKRFFISAILKHKYSFRISFDGMSLTCTWCDVTTLAKDDLKHAADCPYSEALTEIRNMASSESEMSEVCIGDKMQISVELIEQMKGNPYQRSELVELVKISRNPDGPDDTKILYFKRV